MGKFRELYLDDLNRFFIVERFAIDETYLRKCLVTYHYEDGSDGSFVIHEPALDYISKNWTLMDIVEG